MADYAVESKLWDEGGGYGFPVRKKGLQCRRDTCWDTMRQQKGEAS